MKEIYRTKNGYALWVGANNSVYLADRKCSYNIVIYTGETQKDAYKYLERYLENQKEWLGVLK